MHKLAGYFALVDSADRNGDAAPSTLLGCGWMVLSLTCLGRLSSVQPGAEALETARMLLITPLLWWWTQGERGEAATRGGGGGDTRPLELARGALCAAPLAGWLLVRSTLASPACRSKIGED